MAGLDGVANKIHPGPAMDKNLYDLPPAELAKVPTVCGSLQEAIDSLVADHDFLIKGGNAGVFCFASGDIVVSW